MQLLRLSEVESRGAGVRRVYRDASWRALLLAAGVMAAVAVVVALPKGESPPSLPLLVFTGGVAAFFAGLLTYRWLQCRRPDNWLLQQHEDGLYVHLGHFLNPPAGPADEVVVFIPRAEVAAVGKTHEVRKLPDRHGQPRYFSYIDVYLSHEDTAVLGDALRRERRRSPAHRRHVCPVRLPAPGVVRLLWDRVHPPENTAIELLAQDYALVEDRTVDYVAWDRLGEAEKQAVIDDLWETGHVEEATRLHRLQCREGRHGARRYFAARARE